ncbi:tlde1 domain-containing protein [Klebsiella electrica]|uniref:tlde1 domain-containing protein n=1 Tax=Klebsiella electrica TaxID=1259973 RepID=UPI003F76CDA6
MNGAVSDWLSGNLHRNDSRATFSGNGMIDDLTWVGEVQRGHFRLHPAGYKGVSEGCITLPRLSDFMLLRAALLNTPTIQEAASLTAFGTVQVY